MIRNRHREIEPIGKPAPVADLARPQRDIVPDTALQQVIDPDFPFRNAPAIQELLVCSPVRRLAEALQEVANSVALRLEVRLGLRR